MSKISPKNFHGIATTDWYRRMEQDLKIRTEDDLPPFSQA
jgi:hypothetical protein